MMKAVLLVVLMMSLAQILPSCDGGSKDVVIGWVEEKRFDRIDGIHTITINGTDYQVPAPFWREVQIGDLVKWDGTRWTIVKKAGT